MTVSIIVPCYNPPAGWEQAITASWSTFSGHTNDVVELVIVMDGIKDTAPGPGISFPDHYESRLKLIRYEHNMGKGFALRQGVAAATGDIIIYTDVDFPYTMDSMVTIYHQLINDQCDVAIGVKDEAYYGHVPFVRRIMSRMLRFFIRLFLSMPITDTQCGLKGFKKNMAPLFLATTINRYLFDLEFVRNCYKSKAYRVNAIPITLKENIHFRSVNYRILLSEAVNFAQLLFRRHSKK